MKDKFLKSDKYLLATIFLALALSVIFYCLAFKRFETFFSYEWEDIAWNDGFLKNISTGNWQNIKELFYGSYANFHIFPVSVLLGFLYPIIGDIRFIFAYSAISVFFAAVPLFLIARKLSQKSAAAFAGIFAYFLYAPKNNMIFLDGDFTILCISLIPWAFYFLMEKKVVPYLMALIFIGLCRTEAPLVSAFICLYAVISEWKAKHIFSKRQITAAIFFLIWTVFNMYIYSHFNNDSDLNQISVMDSWIKYLELKLSYDKIQPIVVLLLYVFFLPVFSMEFIVAIPSIILLFLSTAFTPQKGHYFNFMIPVIFISLFFLFDKYREKHKKRANIAVLAVIFSCFFSNFLPNIIGTINTTGMDSRDVQDKRFIYSTNMYDPIFYTLDDEDIKAKELIKMIPDNATVSASGDLLPHISSRESFFELFDPQKNYINSDFIISRKRYMYLGAGAYYWNLENLKNIIYPLKANPDWNLVYEDENFIFLKRRSFQ